MGQALIIDTHAHIYLKHFAKDLKPIIERAKLHLSHILMPNIDLASVPQMHQLANDFPEICYPMMGLHPCSVQSDFETVLAQMKTLLDQKQSTEKPYIGIGETGTDLYHDKTTLDLQKKSLQIQLEWALEYNLPIVLHSRDSFNETYKLVAQNQNGNLKGVFHCFTGTEAEALQIIEIGFKMGIGGVATYNNSGVADVVAKIVNKYHFDPFVLETDSPYLPPVPHRGKRNEPSYTRFVAQRIADACKMPLNEVIEYTSQNALDLFPLQKKTSPI